MWYRKELKARGKAAFQANYWRCVLVAVILAMIVGGVGAATGGNRTSNAVGGSMDPQTWAGSAEAMESIPPRMLAVVGVTVLGAMAIFVIVDIFVLNPLEVGCQRFFLENGKEPAKLGELSFGFENGYRNVVKTIFLRDLYLFLWTLLFVIPGVVKGYSYRMTPFILADDPSVTPEEAITRSREMMNGQKWRAFVLDLSFFGWWILSCITLGIVGVFYVAPYHFATVAELYRALKGDDAPALPENNGWY